MLRPRWRKVLRDLWLNKNRTIVVVLSIAVGVFAVGTIASSYIILSRDLTASYLATNPAHAWILSFDTFDDDVVKAVENLREVKEAEGRRSLLLRVKTGPDEWLPLWPSPILTISRLTKFDRNRARGLPPPTNYSLNGLRWGY